MLKYVDEILSFRKRLVPESNKLREIEVVDAWAVRWRSRHGEFSGETQPEIEVFANRDLAEEFAESLRMAFRLIRTTSGDKVKVMRSDGGPQ